MITQERLKDLLFYDTNLDQFVIKFNTGHRKAGELLDMSKQRVFLEGREYRLDRLKTLYTDNVYTNTNISAEITWEELVKVLIYDVDTGMFYWKETRGPPLIGSVAGSIENTGYISIRIGLTAYLAHRLAWFYCFREWPKHIIDHIDRNKTNNKLDNLRDVTQEVNQHNRKINKNNTSGFKGVYKKRDKWAAEIIINGTKHRLGTFISPELASIAYNTFEKDSGICVS